MFRSLINILRELNLSKIKDQINSKQEISQRIHIMYSFIFGVSLIIHEVWISEFIFCIHIIRVQTSQISRHSEINQFYFKNQLFSSSNENIIIFKISQTFSMIMKNLYSLKSLIENLVQNFCSYFTITVV